MVGKTVTSANPNIRGIYLGEQQFIVGNTNSVVISVRRNGNVNKLFSRDEIKQTSTNDLFDSRRLESRIQLFDISHWNLGLLDLMSIHVLESKIPSNIWSK